MKKISREQIKIIVEEEVRKKSDIKKIAKKMETFSSQLEPLFNTITDRIEFEQFLKDSIRLGSKNIEGTDIILAMNRVIKQLRKEMK